MSKIIAFGSWLISSETICHIELDYLISIIDLLNIDDDNTFWFSHVLARNHVVYEVINFIQAVKTIFIKNQRDPSLLLPQLRSALQEWIGYKNVNFPDNCDVYLERANLFRDLLCDKIEWTEDLQSNLPPTHNYKITDDTNFGAGLFQIRSKSEINKIMKIYDGAKK